VALRRLAPPERRALWRLNRGRLVAGGVAIAGLFSVPLLNLLAPLLAAAFMLHLFVGLRRAALR